MADCMGLRVVGVVSFKEEASCRRLHLRGVLIVPAVLGLSSVTSYPVM